MNRVKISFPCIGPSGEPEVETMWAISVEHGYEIDSIPFYASGVACGDVVQAVRDGDGVLRHQELVRAGGHSTIRLCFFDLSVVAPIRAELSTLGCASEGSDLPNLVAVDVPPKTDYVEVRKFLVQKTEAGLLDYEESCLAHPLEEL